MPDKGATYADAGVDIDAANKAVRNIGEAVRRTHTSDVVVGRADGFGGMYRLTRAGARNYILVSTIDGVGTKIQVAEMAGRFGTVGPDIVNHCANDILCMGARPLFMLDYYGAYPMSGLGESGMTAWIIGEVVEGERGVQIIGE